MAVAEVEIINFGDRLKLIDDNHKKCVYGYIRLLIIEKYQNMNMPTIIVDIITIFSHLWFQWDLDRKSHKLTASNNSLKVWFNQVSRTGFTPTANIYSSTIMDKNLIYIIKIQTFNFVCSIFGIVEAKHFANSEIIKNNSFGHHVSNAFGYGGTMGYKYKYNNIYEKYGPILKHNDIIEMIFDKINGTLSYKINNKYIGIAWKDIDIDLNYKFGGYMYSKKESFQIIDFYTMS